MKNLNVEVAKIEGRTMQGLINAANLIRRETEKNPPLTPVDLGNLRYSWFIATGMGVPTGRGSSGFKGRKSGLYMASHKRTLNESQSEVRGGPKNKKYIIMGYSVPYAGFVHEMIPAPGVATINWSRRGSGGQWFQRAIDKRKKDIVKIIAESAKIPKR